MIMELIDAIKLVRDNIAKHARTLSTNEALTRYALVDPILRALGWDTEDPEIVVPEYSTPTGTPDYVLFWNGKEYIAVEVKSLGKNLTSALANGFRYCWSNRIPFYLITDGNLWELHEVLTPGGRKIFELQINGSSHDSTYHIIHDLIILHRLLMPIPLSFTSRTSPASSPPSSASAVGSTTSSPNALLPPTTPPSPPSPTLPPASITPTSSSAPAPGHPGAKSISLHDLVASASHIKNSPPPSNMTCPDGTRIPLSTWKSILVETIKYLDKHGMLPAPPYHYRGNSGSPLYVLGTSVKIRDPEVVQTSYGRIQVTIGWNSENLVKRAEKLITDSGLSSRDFILSW